jgi:hypothetical protein
MIQISSSLSLPEDAVTQTFAFLARRGAGKSYGAMKLAEGMLDAKAQVVAIDPVGVWYSLRIAADGKGAGYDLPIFGGLHADVPLEPESGAFIADLIVDRGISAVLDVSQFRKHDRLKFALDFAEQLFHRKKQRRSPMHLFIEEAQVFVPQTATESRGGDRHPKGGFYSSARMLGAFEDIIKLGRNFGIGATLISQRPQSVNKDALNQTEALFVLQTNGAQERKALQNWITEQGIESKGLVDELPALPIGTAYLWSPSWLRKLEKVKIGKRKTYDASATPVAGMEHIEPRPLSPAELTEVEKAMAATIERAKADDPKALRARIAELEKATRSAPAATVEIEKRVEVPVLAPSVAQELRDQCAGIGSLLDRYTAVTDQIQGALARIQRPSSVVAPPPRAAAPKAVPVKRSATALELTSRPGERRMLIVLAMRHPTALTRQQLGTLAGVKATGGSFGTYLSRLRGQGFISESGGAVGITAEGLASIRDEVPAAPQSTEEIIAQWANKLQPGSKRMLDELIAVHPKALTKAQLGERAQVDPIGGSFGTYLSRLKTIGLVEVDGGEVRASETLFVFS